MCDICVVILIGCQECFITNRVLSWTGSTSIDLSVAGNYQLGGIAVTTPPDNTDTINFSSITSTLAGPVTAFNVNFDASNVSLANPSVTITNQLNVANATTAALTVGNNATLSATGTYVIVGNQAGAVGTIVVSGASAAFKTTAFLAIGNNGTGTVAASNGAVVTTGQISIGQFSGGKGILSVASGAIVTSVGTFDTLGNFLGSVGPLTVDGSASLFPPLVSCRSAAAARGNSGSGTLSVSNGGSVSVAGLTLASGNTGDGKLIVSGSGVVVSSKQINLGQAGFATASILSGGTLSGTSILDAIGNGVGATGSLVVSGAGSLWKSAGTLLVGNNSTAAL